MKTSEEMVNGLMRYINKEVIPKMNTSGKWMLGTVVGMAEGKAHDVALTIQGNDLAKALGAVNADGLFNEELIADAMHKAAERYGKLQMSLPLAGTLTFSVDDVEQLRRYIRGELA